MSRKTADSHASAAASAGLPPRSALPRRRLLANAAALAGLGLMSSACAGLVPGSDREGPRLFTLAPEPPESGARLDANLAIGRPFADAGLDTARIALRRNPLEIEYYAGANWQTRAPDLLRSAMVNALSDSGRFATVTRDPLARESLVVELDLRRFDAQYGEGSAQTAGAPKVLVQMAARLRRADAREVMAARIFRAEAQASRDGMTEIVMAFDTALTELLADLADWVQAQAPASAGEV